jgi:superfamily II DNA or RNA helicase
MLPSIEEWLLDLQQAARDFVPQREKIAGLFPGNKLYEHQNRAVSRFIANDGNILLAHGVGSGKTLSGITMAEEGRKKGIVKNTLVVVPASLRNNFLENGIHRYTDSTGVIYGNQQESRAGTHASIASPPKADYHIVSAEMFRKDPAKWISGTKADTVIYDELHRAKDESGLTFNAIKAARPLHRNFIGLTGSFISNSPSDIVPLVDAMTNGRHKLGTRGEFQRNYVYTDPTGKKRLRNLGKLVPLISKHIDYFGTDQMRASDIPRKQVEEVYVEMSPHQHGLFNYALGKLDPKIVDKLKKDISSLSEKEISHIFSRIIHARKISNSIHTLDDRMPIHESAEKTPKVRRLLGDIEQHIRETPDAQVVAYTNLVNGGVDVLSAGLKSRGIDHGVFMGKRPGHTEEGRQKDVDDFKAGKKKVLVVSSAGAEGLNLPNTTFFASLDGHFNPERILQAEARGVRAGGLAHRDPRDRKVLVRRYVTISPRGHQSFLGGLWNTFSSMFSTPPAKDKNILDVPSVDKWIYDVAKRKHYLNSELRNELRKTGAEIALTAPQSLREEYHDRFGHLFQEPGSTSHKSMSEGEAKFIQQVKNMARARVLTPHLVELLQEALAIAPGDPKLLAILALIYQQSQGMQNIGPHDAKRIVRMSDMSLRDMIKGTPKIEDLKVGEDA